VPGGVPPYEIRWDFGDGTNSTDEDPSHTYEEAGTYEVELSAEDSRGRRVERTLTVLVEPADDGSLVHRGLDSLAIGAVIVATVGAIGAGAWLVIRRSRRPR